MIWVKYTYIIWYDGHKTEVLLKELLYMSGFKLLQIYTHTHTHRERERERKRERERERERENERDR